MNVWLTSVQPRRVVTYGLDGGYGHVDHLAVTKVLMKLQEDHVFELWQTVFKPGTFDDLRGYLQRKEPQLISKDVKDAAGVPPEICIENPVMMEKKRLALSYYATQLQGRAVEQFLGVRAMRQLLSSESFAPMTR